jgi:hypothetical protein
MTAVSLKTPQNVGTRDLVREWLVRDAPAELAGRIVEVDCSPLRAPTPSFLDEMLKILVIERGAARVELRRASDRARALAARSAQNRRISGRIGFVEETPQGWLHRLRGAAR